MTYHTTHTQTPRLHLGPPPASNAVRKPFNEDEYAALLHGHQDKLYAPEVPALTHEQDLYVEIGRRIFSFLGKNPYSHATAVARHVGLSPQNVRKRLNQMSAVGLVVIDESPNTRVRPHYYSAGDVVKRNTLKEQS